MPPLNLARRLVLTAVGLLAMAVLPGWSQEPPTSEAMGGGRASLETPSALEVPALRQQVTDRIKAKADAIALKRPLVAPELNKLPHVNVDIQFNPDTPVIRPEFYLTLGSIADVLTNPALMSFTFLIVGRVEANGRRENTLGLTRRRAGGRRAG